jgi:HEAT repeat protein
VGAVVAFLFVSSLPAGAQAPTARPTAPVDDTVIRRLIEGLGHPDLDVRQNLAVALAKIGSASVEPLIEALKDTSAERRAGAAYALGQIGSGARAALPALLDLLKDGDVGVRRQASYAIGKIVPAGRPASAVAVTPAANPAGGGGK